MVLERSRGRVHGPEADLKETVPDACFVPTKPCQRDMFTIARFIVCCLLLLSGGSVGPIYGERAVSGYETVRTSNAAILNRLGLAPLRIPDGHHKKRLAGPEPPGLSSQTRAQHQPYGRRHGQRDSHVYIVKLPASPPYYAITKPHKSAKGGTPAKTGPSLPVGFQGNGKPAKIYHWNLPVVKKIGEKKRLHTGSRLEQAERRTEDAKRWYQQQNGGPKAGQVVHGETSERLDDGTGARRKASPSKHARNNDKRLTYPDRVDGTKADGSSTKGNGYYHASNKTYRLDDSAVHGVRTSNELHGTRNAAKAKKHRKKAAMSYYAPITGKSGSTSIHKSFPGNGKPKAFYVMEKSRKPVYYHPLLP